MKHKPKKSLGQNFLKSEAALRKIIEAGEVGREDTVLEIGPGKGALTAKLLQNAGTVLAVEKDNDLYEFLQAKFETEIKSGTLVLLNEDILEFNTSAQGLKPSAYKIIANIPYNITGAILKKFLTSTHQPERMVLLVQKEVAQRITAVDGRESILSISVKAYGDPRLVMKVPARYFSPSPKVDSAIISIKSISRRTFQENGIDEERFWEIVRAGFAHKRKKLSSNLKILPEKFKISSSEDLGNRRAEELTLREWINLAKN